MQLSAAVAAVAALSGLGCCRWLLVRFRGSDAVKWGGSGGGDGAAAVTIAGLQQQKGGRLPRSARVLRVCVPRTAKNIYQMHELSTLFSWKQI